MLRRAFVLLLGTLTPGALALSTLALATLGLTGCGSPKSDAPSALHQPLGSTGSVGPTMPGGSGQVAILLPLSGKLAEIGKPMLRAAQLALSVPGSPTLDVKDTGGSPEGAARAAGEAIASGAKVIIGPLTTLETGQVAPIARRAGVPVLAFTNDQAQSQPGVWTLGITPGQQVRRLLGAVQAAGKVPVAAILPDNDFGKAMGDELTRIAAAAGQQPPFVRMIGPGKDQIGLAVNELAGASGPDQPFPYGAIMLASIGNDLRTIAKALSDAKIDRGKVQILGPALWVEPASGSAAVTGAWFAMPNPDARRDMVKDYNARYKDGPPPRADLAYDAASITRVLGAQGRMNTAGLVQPQGFAGVDGWFALLPDGQVRRGLAVFRVDRSRVTKVGDAPTGPAPAGS